MNEHKTIVPIVDLPKFKARGWNTVRVIGSPPKSVLMEKDERDENDPPVVRVFRGG